jgi:restriction system protein
MAMRFLTITLGFEIDTPDEQEVSPRPDMAEMGPKKAEHMPRRQAEFRRPLLETLRDLGGKSTAKFVRKRMELKLAPKLNGADYSPVGHGEPRWWKHVCWQRFILVKQGLLRDDSKRGVWELSERGFQFLVSR